MEITRITEQNRGAFAALIPEEFMNRADKICLGAVTKQKMAAAGMTVRITYTIDDEAEPLTAEGLIKWNFEGNTTYTLRMSLTPSTKGLEITLVQSAFTPWQDYGDGEHTVYNW